VDRSIIAAAEVHNRHAVEADMALSILEQHCIDELQRLADAQQRIRAVLERAVDRATDFELSTVLREHLEQGDDDTLEELFGILDASSAPKTHAVVRAILAPAERAFDTPADPQLVDAILLECILQAYRVDATTRTLVSAWLHELGHPEASEILAETAMMAHARADDLETLAPEIPTDDVDVDELRQPPIRP
jgi:ferritin-like metal-binding protein YciE